MDIPSRDWRTIENLLIYDSISVQKISLSFISASFVNSISVGG